MKVKISRETSIFVKKFLNNFLPPALRDSEWLMKPLMYLAFGDKSKIFTEFRKRGYQMTDEEFADAYVQTQSVNLHGETDLNEASCRAILDHLVGKNAVDVGSGRAFLADKISKKNFDTTACDINQPAYLKEKFPHIHFVEGDVENLPFEDKSFDTVICTHTLEHVRHLSKAMDELRRITKKRLIIVVPMERPYEFDFNLHLNFFTYPWMFLNHVGKREKQAWQNVGDDLFYYEDK